MKHSQDTLLVCDASQQALTHGWDRRHKLMIEFDASLPAPGTYATTGVIVRINGLCIQSVSRRQSTVANSSCEAETKAAQAASELGKGYQDTLAELLQIWPSPTLLSGDCRPSVKQIEKATDRRSQASYKKSLGYVEADVNGGRSMMNLIPRDYNSADNNTQQGAPFDRWLARSNAIMGISPEVYVSDTIRDILQFNIDQIEHASTSQDERRAILRGSKRAIFFSAQTGGYVGRKGLTSGDLFERGFIYQRDPAKDSHPLIDRLFRRQVPGPVTLAILCASTPLTPTTMTDLWVLYTQR